MSGYQWTGGGEEQRQKEVDAELESIRAEAKRRTGWEEWMTETVGWGALDPDFVRLAERKDSGRLGKGTVKFPVKHPPFIGNWQPSAPADRTLAYVHAL